MISCFYTCMSKVQMEHPLLKQKTVDRYTYKKMVQWKIVLKPILLICGFLALLQSNNLHSQTNLRYDFFTIPCTNASESNGQIDLRLISGVEPIQIFWSHGTHQLQVSNLPAGMYTCTIIDGDLNPYLARTEIMVPKVFDWSFLNTGQNASILILPDSTKGINAKAGDYFGAFYQLNGSLQCGGYNQWSGNGPLAITAWGDNSFTPEKDGFDINEPYIIAYFDSESNRQFFIQTDYRIEGISQDGFYTPNGIHIIEQSGNITGLLSSSSIDHSKKNLLIYPNPSTGKFFIHGWNSPKNQNNNAVLYSSAGKKMLELDSQSAHQEVNISHLPAGIYILHFPYYQQSLKILLK